MMKDPITELEGRSDAYMFLALVLVSFCLQICPLLLRVFTKVSHKRATQIRPPVLFDHLIDVAILHLAS